MVLAYVLGLVITVMLILQSWTLEAVAAVYDIHDSLWCPVAAYLSTSMRAHSALCVC